RSPLRTSSRRTAPGEPRSGSARLGSPGLGRDAMTAVRQDGAGRDDAETLVDTLRRLARDRAGSPMFTWLDDDGQDREHITAGQMRVQAEWMGELLTGAGGLPRGSRVVLASPPSLEFVRAFAGCLVAGLVPVPVAPPNPFRLRQDVSGF